MTCLDMVAFLAIVAVLAGYFYQLIDRDNRGNSEDNS